ncbi:MAG TPA: sensor domain-containing diguanylate cyclase [Longimicrobium sp.]
MTEVRSDTSHAPQVEAAHNAPALGIHALAGRELERFLQRQKAGSRFLEIDLEAELGQILERACALVPSECGAVFLDDPLRKVEDRAANDLFVVAAFGADAETLPGRPAGAESPVGEVYRSGRPHLSGGAGEAESVVAVPITIGSTVCGVIELANRDGGCPFSPHDLAVLEIFAGYTSSTLQNALDAKRANELAKRDDLSGLYNDRWMHVRIGEMIAETDEEGGECVLVFMDLDHFKGVNDSYGHLAGSRVLREIGFLLRRVVDWESAILCRYGGDEFVIGLPSTTLAEGTEVAERVRAAIAEATYLDREYGPDLPPLFLRGAITASLGVAAYHAGDWGGTVHDRESILLRHADSAMYAAKAQGKDRVAAAP